MALLWGFECRSFDRRDLSQVNSGFICLGTRLGVGLCSAIRKGLVMRFTQAITESVSPGRQDAKPHLCLFWELRVVGVRVLYVTCEFAACCECFLRVEASAEFRSTTVLLAQQITAIAF